MQVLPNIRVLGGVVYDSNTWLIDGELIVDCGTGKFFTELKDEIIAEGFDPSKIKMIVLTHYHYDHSGGAKKFRDWLNAKIYIHSADAGYIEHGETLANIFGEAEKSTTADVLLEDKDEIKTKNFIFQVIHTPGHTQGSICLYEKRKKILISGDTLFADGFGRTDLPGGNSEEMKKSLRKLIKLDINYLLPGHGNPKVSGVSFLIKQILTGSLGHRHR